MAKKRSLGKGLGALIKDTSLKDHLESKINSEIFDKILEIDVNNISPNKEQTRQIFDNEKLKELSQSITSVGLISPILVTKSGTKKYTLIAGERRWRAAKLAGFKKIPAILKDNSDEKTLELIIIENIQREDLSPIEEASGYNLLLEKNNLTHEKLSKIVGKSRTHITNILRFLSLPTEIRQLINNKKLSAGHAKVIAVLTPKLMKDIAEKIVKNNLSVRETEDIINNNVPRGTSNKKKTTAINKKKSSHLIDLEEKFRSFFKTKVSISDIKNNIGKIEIEYYHNDDIDLILKKLKL